MLPTSKKKIAIAVVALVSVIAVLAGLRAQRRIHFMLQSQSHRLGQTIARAILPHAAAQRAFYFWKTQWTGSPELVEGLKANGVNRLYLRFFDVRWDPALGSAQPVSPIQVQAALPKGLEIVPVVYVTNSVFINAHYEDVEQLGNQVWNKVTRMAQANGVQVHELQIDCDWSDSSRFRYFHFVDLLRRKLNKEHIQISSTIRLHQIKYADRTGVPPVNRGMLMFYNFGRIQADSDRSSIFNATDAARYSSYIADYKMPLDISLPLFSWIVHSRDGKVLELIERLDPEEVRANNAFKLASTNRFEATRALFFHGRYFMAGDSLLVEETTPAVTAQAADLAVRGSSALHPYSTIAFFDLDERTMKRYENSDFKKILNQFR